MPEGTRKARPSDREILSKLVSALAGLSNETAKLMDRQLGHLREIKELSPKFDVASKHADFWKNAAKGLAPEDVASFFLIMGKLTELGGSLAKFNTLPEGEQERVLKEYKAMTKSLNELDRKLKSG